MKKAKETQSLADTLPKDPVINVSDSPKNKKRLAEDAEPSSPKKRKVARKSKAVASKLTDLDNFDDYVNNMDLDISDDVSSQKLYLFLSVLKTFSRSPQVELTWVFLCYFTYRCSFCSVATREESPFDCPSIYESAAPERQPRRYCVEIVLYFEMLIF